MNEILYKLGEAQLSWPRGLKGYVKKIRTPRKNNYVNTLQIWHGKLLMRTFVFTGSTTKQKDLKIQEVCRRLEGERYVLLCQVENLYLAGRNVYYTDDGKWVTKKSNNGWMSWYTGDKKSWWFYEYDFFDVKEWIAKLNIPYCGYNHSNYVSKIPFFEYVELYRKYPKIELLAKAGLHQFIRGARYLNFEGRSFEQIFKVPKKWQTDINKLSVQDLLIIRSKKPDNMQELETIKAIKTYKYIKKYVNKRMLDYINKDISLYEYNDYLRFAEELGMDMSDHRVLCPSEAIHFAHDKLMHQIADKRSGEIRLGIESVANELEKFKYTNGKYTIVIPHTQEDLIKESKVLNHCVRTYADRVAKRETSVLFIRSVKSPDVPLYTIEFKNKKVLQFRGNHNKSPDEGAQAFVNEWLTLVVNKRRKTI